MPDADYFDTPIPYALPPRCCCQMLSPPHGAAYADYMHMMLMLSLMPPMLLFATLPQLDAAIDADCRRPPPAAFEMITFLPPSSRRRFFSRHHQPPSTFTMILSPAFDFIDTLIDDLPLISPLMIRYAFFLLSLLPPMPLIFAAAELSSLFSLFAAFFAATAIICR